MQGANDRLIREQKDRIELAWMIANLSRAEKLPKLSELLDETESQKEQSPEAQQAFFDALAVEWGAKG